MKAAITILGSTGSIGQSTLDVIRKLPDRFEVFALAAHSNWELLAKQIQEFKPRLAVITAPDAHHRLKQEIRGTTTEVTCEHDALVDIATDPRTKIVVGAMAGSSGLAAYLEALRARKRLALANKEPMVMAGGILMRVARENSAEVLPVDSEHSALFQAVRAGSHHEISRIVLTASGGPFQKLPQDHFSRVTPAQALTHPTWKMGKKITVDSATMMNKALEVIEAKHLFDLDPSRISIVIHPQSIVHSMVEFRDGSVIAQMSQPDMRLSIQFALCYPERTECIIDRLRFDSPLELTFTPPDPEKFPALQLGHKAAEIGGVAGAVLNAANEITVENFLQGKIPFDRIVPTVASVLERHSRVRDPSLEDILSADGWARTAARAQSGSAEHDPPSNRIL